MKGDFTRNTFDPKKHYRDVLLQQGRAQVDADWNEQAALTARRDETTAVDIIGDCGGPADDAAFAVITRASNPPKAQPPELSVETGKAQQPPYVPIIPALPPGDFFLSAGRYYVDGIQCENEQPVRYTAQPDRLDVKPLEQGTYLLYLDVWQRHLTALEDGSIRESALGGPDTATRVKTIWQVRALALGSFGVLDTDNPCGLGADAFNGLFDPGTAMLKADTAAQQAPNDPCLVPPGAGYTGLENQLYRVEIHGRERALSGATNVVGDTEATMTGGSNALRPRRAILWKWSRENGSVVTPIEKIDAKKITVSSLGPDKNLGFVKDAWVEILDDALELESQPGQLAQIDDVDEATRIVTLKTAVSSLTPPSSSYPDGVMPERHPKLRRWEGVAPIQFGKWLSLESGVQVNFAANGDYRTGHYWQIAARAATAQSPNGEIEWPENKGNPVALAPRGITHHFCRLGIVTVKAGSIEFIDCRCLWPALTSVPRLFYVSGDGQEVMPDLTDESGKLYILPQPLIVGVANAQCLKRPARVMFTVTSGNGLVASHGNLPVANSAKISTNAAGLARSDFHLDGTNYSQQVTARLLDANDNPVSLPLIFNATLSIASEVAYDPGECGALYDQKTVQEAIVRLASLARLEAVGGDGQDAEPGAELAHPIQVLVTSSCGPVAEAHVQFNVADNNKGTVAALPSGSPSGPTLDVTTLADGLATCRWTPDPDPTLPTQELTATLVLPDNSVLSQPATLRFTANHTRRGNCCTFTVGDGKTSHGQFTSIQTAVDHLPDEGGQICLLPGEFRENIVMTNRHDITISGCGSRSLIVGKKAAMPVIHVRGGQNITIDSLAVVAHETGIGLLLEGRDWSMSNQDYFPSFNVTLTQLLVRAATRSAIHAQFVQQFTIRECAVQMQYDTVCLEHAIFALGDDMLIERNVVETVGLVHDPDGPKGPAIGGFFFFPGTNSSGGIHIGALSDRVWIDQNLIRGGGRNGITLGSTVFERDIAVGPGDHPKDANLRQFDPGQAFNFIPPPTNGGRGRFVDAGPLSEIRIERNRIYDMGGCGIGVERFYDLRGQDEFIRVDQLTILGNHIRHCLLRPIAEPDPAIAPFVGYGGISLADVHRLVIHDNLIEGCGFSPNDPVCGIFVLQAEGCDLSRNRLFDNGIGDGNIPQKTTAPKRGHCGGIVIAFALAPKGPPLTTTLLTPTGPRTFELSPPTGEPAAKIHDNIVTAPVGQALHLNALGPVSVEGNHFTTRGVVEGFSAAFSSQLAATVWILNLGVSNEFYLGYIFFATGNAASLPGLDQFAPGRSLATGQVLFNGNQVTFDAFDPGAGIALSSVLIVTADDLGFQDNQCQSNLFTGDLVVTQSLLLGFSSRTNSNRFTEGVWNALFSAVTLGWIANTTTCNQATHCILSRCISPPGNLRYALNIETFGANPLFRQTECATIQESFDGIEHNNDNFNNL